MAYNYFAYELIDGKIQTATTAQNVTFTDSGDLVGLTAHGFAAGTQVAFPSISSTTGITINTKYYVINPLANSFQVATTAGGSAVTLTTDGTGTVRALVESDLLYANKIDLKGKEVTYTWNGDGQEREIYGMVGMTAEIPVDCVPIAALQTIFNKSVVSSGLPTGLASLTWFGEAAETGGVSAGLWANAYAARRDTTTGVESTVVIRIWLPLGTLTLSAATGLESGKKAGLTVLKLGAVRATADVTGAALPSVPTGGAFYAIAELS